MALARLESPEQGTQGAGREHRRQVQLVVNHGVTSPAKPVDNRRSRPCSPDFFRVRSHSACYGYPPSTLYRSAEAQQGLDERSVIKYQEFEAGIRDDHGELQNYQSKRSTPVFKASGGIFFSRTRYLRIHNTNV